MAGPPRTGAAEAEPGDCAGSTSLIKFATGVALITAWLTTIAGPAAAGRGGGADPALNHPAYWGDDCYKIDHGVGDDGDTWVSDGDYRRVILKAALVNDVFDDVREGDALTTSNGRAISHYIICTGSTPTTTTTAPPTTTVAPPTTVPTTTTTVAPPPTTTTTVAPPPTTTTPAPPTVPTTTTTVPSTTTTTTSTTTIPEATTTTTTVPTTTTTAPPGVITSIPSTTTTTVPEPPTTTVPQSPPTTSTTTPEATTTTVVPPTTTEPEGATASTPPASDDDGGSTASTTHLAFTGADVTQTSFFALPSSFSVRPSPPGPGSSQPDARPQSKPTPPTPDRPAE